MIDQIIRYIKGYVRIRVSSPEMERFLNLCANNGLLLYRIEDFGGGCELEIGLSDLFRLQPICRKTHTRIHIVLKKGLPFFFHRNRKRRALFAGIVICFGLLGLLSTRIWNIHVDGNHSYSTQAILQYLESQEVRHGIAKKDLSCAKIAAGIREHFPDMIWVAAKISGTRLVISVQENMDPVPEKASDAGAPSDLVATKDGEILRMVTRQGIPQAQVGDQCEKGQILIRGLVDIINDNGELVRQAQVPADGDVYIKTAYPYYKEFPLTYEKRIYTGRTRKSFVVQIHSLELQAGLPGRSFTHYDRVGRFKDVKLTENFYLPISYGTDIAHEYRIVEKRYTEEEARALAREQILAFLDEMMEKRVEILENNVTIEVTQTKCISKGTVYGLEKNGEPAPLSFSEQPTERTTDE